MQLPDYIRLSVFELAFAFSFAMFVYLCLCTVRTLMTVTLFVVMYICLRAIRRKLTERIKVKGQGVFITGCDTGFGHDLAIRLDGLGFTVFAGCYNPNGQGAKQLKSTSSRSLYIVPLDVTKDDSVKQAHDYVVKHLPKSGLWALVNNAGIFAFGDVEWCTMRQYQAAMDVNFFGTLRVTKAFGHLVRRSKGRVVMVTSCLGRFSQPGCSAYHATKYALETVSDSLRFEMLKFGVKVSIIEPGVFCSVTGIQSDEQSKRFRAEIEEMWDSAANTTRNAYGKSYLIQAADSLDSVRDFSATSTVPVIDVMCDAILSQNPDTRYTIGGGNGLIDLRMNIGRCYGFLPTWLTDWFIVKWSKCDKLLDNKKSE